MSTAASQANHDTSPLSLTISSQLVDDYLYLADPPPPALGSQGDLVAAANGAIAVDGTQLMHYRPSRQSQSGWIATPVQVPVPPTAANANIVSITAFVMHGGKDGDPNKSATVLNVLCLFQAQGWENSGGFAVSWIAHELDDDDTPVGDWFDVALTTAAASYLSLVTQIGEFNAGAGIGNFVYGATPNILGRDNARLFLIALDDYLNLPTSGWHDQTDVAARQLGVPPQTTAQYAFMTIGSADSPREVALAWWQGAALNVALSATPSELPNLQSTSFVAVPTSFANGGVIDTLTPLEGNNTTFGAVLVDSNGGVWRYARSPDNTQGDYFQLNGGGNGPSGVDAVALARCNGKIALFAQAGGTLWLLRNLEGSVGFMPPPWANLGNQVVAIAAPAIETQALELFYADAQPAQQNQIFHLSRDGADSVWVTKKLATFTTVSDPLTGKLTKPQKGSSILIDVAVTHKDRNIPRHPNISIECDQWAALLIRDASYWIGPGRNADVIADEFGKLGIRIEATSLKFPKLRFVATKRDLYAEGTCQGDVEGTGSQSESSVANRLANKDPARAITAENLKQRNLMPQDTDDDTAQHVVHMIRNTGQFLLNKSKPGAAPATAAPRSWHLEIGPDGSVSGRETAPDPKALSAISFGSFFGGIGGDIGDALHWAKHAIGQAMKWTVTVADDGIHVLLNGVHFLVDTAREAGDLAVTILCTIQKGLKDVEAFIKEVIAFLELLFEWKDIIKTAQALYHMITWAFSYATSEIGTFQTFVDRNLGKLQCDIGSYLDAAEKHFAASGTTANQHVDKLANRTCFLAGASYKQHLHHHTARCMYVQHVAGGHVQYLNEKGPDSSNLGTTVNGSWGDTKKFSGLSDIDVDNLFGTAIADLLRVVKEMISYAITGLKDVADVVLGLMVEAIASVQKIITFTPTIPVLSWLFNKLTGLDLNLLSLFCLVLAVPVTIFFKLFKLLGAAAPAAAAPGAPEDSAYGAFWDDFTKAFVMTGEVATLDFAKWSEAELKQFTTVMPYMAGVLDLFASLVGIYADMAAIAINVINAYGIPTVSTVVVSWINWLLSVMALLFSMPVGTFAQFDSSSPADIAQTIYYCTEFLPLITDAVFLMPQECLAKMAAEWGAIAEGAAGLAILGAAIAYVVESSKDDTAGSTAWDYVNAIITSVPRPFRALMPLTQGGNVPMILAVTAIVLAGDAVGLIGGTATQLGSSVEG